MNHATLGKKFEQEIFSQDNYLLVNIHIILPFAHMDARFASLVIARHLDISKNIC